MSEPKFMSPQELSDRWGGRISVRTLANWRTQGSGPAFTKIGGAVLYSRDKLVEYENRNTVNSTSQYGSTGA
ncbi:helix-turn-helix domain-containing protein [Pseudomonas sp.]|jgi:hypothetical protein|uniref:helix-turn-helix domain-containing protein n=1 Tax=Pseudomonas sp. TaxID=306 RepID=UPI003FD71820